MQETVIDAHNLSKIYDEKTIPVYALNKVHLHISRGEFTAIKGPSGSGKSTIALRMYSRKAKSADTFSSPVMGKLLRNALH